MLKLPYNANLPENLRGDAVIFADGLVGAREECRHDEMDRPRHHDNAAGKVVQELDKGWHVPLAITVPAQHNGGRKHESTTYRGRRVAESLGAGRGGKERKAGGAKRIGSDAGRLGREKSN